MAKPPKLKVFVTPVGFHDAYVAAPSRKAALRAWGSTHDLFARGNADEVTDPALTAAPLARPGEVVKVLRGTRDEQLAALPEDKPCRREAPPEPAKPGRSRPSRPEPPSRAALEAARAALADAQAASDRDLERLAQERRELDRREAAARRRADAERDRLQAAADEAEQAFTAASKRFEQALDAYKAAS